MPKYCFWCDSCNGTYVETISMSKIEGYKGVCPECSSRKVFRDYSSEGVRLSEGIKTIGSYADRNAERLSEDEKISIDARTRPEDYYK